MKPITQYLLISLISFSPLLVLGQQAFDARAAGMAFSNGAAAQGLEQVGLNPAVLALKTPFNFEFNLFSLNLGVTNNSFGKSEYDQYLTTGDFLNSEDINTILGDIPDGGFRADGFARINTISFYIPRFSLSLVGEAFGTLNIPSEVFELALKGNASDGRIYKFDDSNGNDWTGIGVFMSGAFPFHFDDSSPLDLLTIGTTLKYHSGFHFDKIVKAQGEFQDFSALPEGQSFINLNGELEVISSNGGSGFSADLGMILKFRKKLTFGLTILNPIASYSWDQKNEKRLYTVLGDSLSLPSNFSDSLIVTTDTVFATGSFSSNLPALLDFAIAYQSTGNLLVTAEYEQGLDNNMGGTKRPRLAMGLEYTGIPVLPLRMGFNLGGTMGPSYSLGAGINLKHWYLNAAFVNHGRIVPGNYKGVSLALTSRLRF